MTPHPDRRRRRRCSSRRRRPGLAANPMVGGAPMFANKNIVENAVNSADHTTLVAAVKAAGLVETLEGAGPFTVFAPNNKAFAALPAGTVDTPARAAEQADADRGAHLPRGAGRLTSDEIKAKVAAMGGAYMVKTVNGEELTFQRRRRDRLRRRRQGRHGPRSPSPTSCSRTA